MTLGNGHLCRGCRAHENDQTPRMGERDNAPYGIHVAISAPRRLIRNDGSILLNRNVTFEPTVEKGLNTKVKYALDKLLSVSLTELYADGDIKEFSKRARDWALFGLLTTPERKAKFHELAVLMRQGTPTDEAVKDAFGLSLQGLVGPPPFQWTVGSV